MELEDLYGDYTEEVADEEAKKYKKKWLKLEAGNNKLRVLPPPRDPKTKQLVRVEPWLVVYEHSIQFPAGWLRVACPRLMNDGAKCPVCAEVTRRKGLNTAKDTAIAKAMDVRRRVYIEVVNRADEAAGVQLFETGPTIHNDLIRLRRDKEIGGDFTHPVKGYDLVIHKENKTKDPRNVKYTCSLGRNSTPLAKTKEQMIEWLTNRIDLTEKLQIPTEEEIIAQIEEKKIASREMQGNDREGTNGSRELPASSGTIPADDVPAPDDELYPDDDDADLEIPF